jgi:pilus assembly protein CpaF
MSLIKLNWNSRKAAEQDQLTAEASPLMEQESLHPEGNEVSELSGDPRQSVQTAETTALRDREAEKESHYLGIKTRIHRRLIDELNLAPLADSNEAELATQVREAVSQLLVIENILLTNSERERLTRDILSEVMGLGPLESLLEDSSVSDILINGPYKVFVERRGRLEQTNIRFKDDQHLRQIIDRIVSAVGRRVDESQPLCDARLKDGSRFNCIIPPLAIDGALVSIRKFSKHPYGIQDLINFGTLDERAAELLKGFVKARLNIVISGGTGAGKTTFLNVLSSFIPDHERIVTIEDAAELQLQQNHIARLETRPSNIEGKGEISQRELFRNALRMRPDRVIVGECRAGEALDMLQAMNTGHDGSLTTLHANSPRDAVRRLETMVLMAGYDLPTRAIREQIASAVDVVVQVSRLSDGRRVVTNVTEILGMEGDVVLLQDIFEYVQRGINEEGMVLGTFRSTGIRPRFLDKLQAAGITVEI